jgi:predicted nucleotidyltransferase
VKFFETIDTETRRRNLQFLVIGGLAVNLHGYSRDTADLDLLIRAGQREQWVGLFSELGYAISGDAGSFIQLSPPQQGAWPVDLMLVQEKTFAPMFSASGEVDLYGTRSRIPSLEHLIALKLHALKHCRFDRFLKDFLDVENLILINRLDIKSENIRQLFAKYGTMELYDKVSRSLAVK